MSERVERDNDDGADAESPDVWGFRDTTFRVNERGHVEVTGSRYELSGEELPDLLPWWERVMGIPVDAADRNPPAYPPEIPPRRSHPGFERQLLGLVRPDQVSDDPQVRLRRGHGHSQREMFAIKYERLPRVPDLVVWPESEEEVAALVEAARRHGVCLLPYGGGTNVTEALSCPADETRPIVAVDMRRMDRVLWIDRENHMAAIEAGATGRKIADELAAAGFTMGHEPDSVEFSTLGGWIATRASGMKKNRYGNIEDLVLDVTVVTPAGTIRRSAVGPRESIGADPRQWVFGSEGTLGIVTSAVVKLSPLPDVQRYDSLLFPSFEDGLRFCRDLEQSGAVPASVRLVDNLQFQFSMALRPRRTGLGAWKRRLQRLWVTRLLRFDPGSMVACTLVYEGSRDEVAVQEAAVERLSRRHGGLGTGAENGRRGYQLTFAIAYIRDFVMGHWVLGESFETSVPWSRALELCENVKRVVREEHARRGLPGRPFVSCRITQLYRTGVCIYFYLGFAYKGVERPSAVFAEIEAAARREILRSGGSLSHHHGVGKLRREFLSEIWSPAALEWTRRAKRALDPDDVFGARNHLPAEEPAPGRLPKTAEGA